MLLARASEIAAQCNVFQAGVFQQVCGVEPDPVVVLEVTWPGTTARKKKRKGPDQGLIRELVRQRDEAIARWRAEQDEHAPEPDVVVELPEALQSDGRRIRELLAPHGIKVVDDASELRSAFAAAVSAETMRQLELQRIEDEELAIVLMLTA
jgi:hypothetical protein